MTTLHTGEIGTAFEFTIMENGAPMDLSSASTKQVIFSKPKGLGSITKTAVFKNDGRDGVIVATAAAGELDVVGRWTVQAFIIMPTGQWYSSADGFDVELHL